MPQIDTQLFKLIMSTTIPYLRFLVCARLFTAGLQRKSNAFPMFCLAFLWMLVSGAAVVAIRYQANLHFTHIVSRVFHYLCVQPYIFLCFEGPRSTKFLCWSGCVATQELGEQLAFLVMALFGTNDDISMVGFQTSLLIRDIPLYFLFRFAIYWVCYKICGKTDQIDYDRDTTQRISAFSVISTLLLSLVSSAIREFRHESAALYYAGTCFVLLYAVTLLIIRTGMLSYGRERHEKALIEQMMGEQTKRYMETKESIDILNMRCHDMKRHLEGIQDKLDRQELEVLRQALLVYDRNIRTGNDILDVFLNSKHLACQEKQITISCMANGRILAFMDIAHLCSLFGNAIDNAVEAVTQIQDPGKRVIDITVAQAGPNAVIHLSNYFSGQVAGNLDTSKPDRNHHGFGIKSIKYVADHYGGTVSINIEQDIFTLEVTIPLPAPEVTAHGN